MIKNYCIKIISSVFIMLTIVLVSTSVFAFTTKVVCVNESILTVEGINSLLSKDIVGNNLVTYYKFDRGSTSISSTYYIALVHTSDSPHWEYTGDKNGFWFNGSAYAYVYNFETSSWNVADYTHFASDMRNYITDGYISGTIKVYSVYNISIYNDTTCDFVTDTGLVLYDASEQYIDSTEKKIIYEVNYAEDNKTAILTAEIKNGAEGDKLYYSTLGYSLTGKLMNPIQLNQSQATAITLNKNTMIHLQALDAER